jgi:anti-sigma B factor antagonist
VIDLAWRPGEQDYAGGVAVPGWTPFQLSAGDNISGRLKSQPPQTQWASVSRSATVGETDMRRTMAGLLNDSGVAAFADEGGFKLDETWHHHVVVISVSGALDLLTAPQLDEAIDSAVSKSPSGVIVDLAKVDFLASAGMNTFVAAHLRLTPACQFGVVADGPVTGRPLKLLGLDKVINVYRSLDSALQAFAEG